MGILCHKGVYSSVVEHLTADQEVTGSNPVGPFSCYYLFLLLHPNNIKCIFGMSDAI